MPSNLAGGALYTPANWQTSAYPFSTAASTTKSSGSEIVSSDESSVNLLPWSCAGSSEEASGSPRVRVVALTLARDGGLLDMDDVVADVLDDKELVRFLTRCS
ncbi:unnamed protein product [Protopolystoma xenopodis]|uniref:Par3/HAL N-terminal domain-containing protein n=1 Tax=Protopolystoma xenopodis TaxID=117903 RepID=A0A3S5FFL7_9PLAT|nr:unnamed protein product [Protopolystoma xenopodis]